MSESVTFDATGQPVQQQAPPMNNRRAHWLNEVKQVRPQNHGKFWIQTKQELLNEMESILERAQMEGREFTSGEEKWYAATESDLKWIDETKVKPYQDEQDRLRDSATPHGNDDDTRNLRLLQREAFRGRHFKELFGQVQERHQFKSFNEFLSIISHNQYDPRMMHAAASGMNETVGSEGGFLIPTEYASRVLDSALEQSVMWGRIRVEPMTTNQKMVSSFVNENNAAGKPFGLDLQWMDEGATFIESKALTKSITLNAKKCGIYVPFSRELSEDGGTTFAKQLMDVCGQSLAWGVDSAIINEDGGGRPLGILASPSTIVVPKESGQPANTFVFENAVNMYSRMHPSCVPNSIWLANPSVMPQLLTMSVSLGSTGTWYPALKEQSGGSTPTYSLLGRNLYLSEKCPPLGQKGDVILVDPSQYILGLRQGITAQLSEHVKFASDEIVLRVTVRLDGKPAWAKVYTPKNGATTSWAVVTATRA